MHVKLVSEEQDEAAEWVIVIGILGMIVSILGNIEAAEEMYPLYLEKIYGQVDAQLRRNKLMLLLKCIPTSVLLSFASDTCIAVYGLYNKDILVALYGALNSLVLFFTILSIQERLYWEHPSQEWA
tara:strand:- start:507 stop:884 length:378 start_codon:yes stop_codon:yes gene_type:complete